MDNKTVKKGARLQSFLPTKRKLIQLYCAVLYNAYARGLIKGEIYTGSSKAVCVPGLNCYSCPAAVGACPLGSLQNALAASGNRAGFYVFGILMLWGLMLGRTICGWACPFGLLQELLHKIPTPKIRKNRVTYVLTYLKYVLLLLFVIAMPLWYGLKEGKAVPGFCKYICPAGTLEGAMGLLSNPANAGFFKMLGIFFTRKYVILLLTGLACVFCYRSFCRFLCPLGAIYGMFNKLAVVGVRVDPDRCTHCGACAMTCGMDVRHVGDRECIHCAKCMEVCKYDAISLKAGRRTLIAPVVNSANSAGTPGSANCAGTPGSAGRTAGSASGRKCKKKTAAWIAAAVLVFVLLWYNVFDQTGKSGAVQAGGREELQIEGLAESAYGSNVGDTLADFTIECTDGHTFRLQDNLGKVTFINLWATYCGPCVEELPYFNALAQEKAGNLAVLAVHSSLSKDDIPAYLSDKGWDNIAFALDTEEDLVWNIVGGGAAMPQTIVLDRSGKVIYNQVGSVTPELLEKLYEQAAQ